jgi:predicted transcriptional regulator
MSTVKDEARKLLDALPENVTWDDIVYEFYVRKKVEIGLEAAEAGEVVDHEEVKREFLSP